MSRLPASTPSSASAGSIFARLSPLEVSAISPEGKAMVPSLT